MRPASTGCFQCYHRRHANGAIRRNSHVSSTGSRIPHLARAIARLSADGEIPDRRSHDRGYPGGDSARRIDIDASCQIIPYPYQGVQRHVCQFAGRDPRARADHADQECASAQCPDDLESAARHTRDVGVRRAQGAQHDGSCDSAPAMPDALEVAARQDAYFASTGKLIGALHGVVFSIKDQYDTFDMRTTAGMDADYANDRPPRDATFVKRLREAGAIILAKANLGEMATPNSRSSFGGPFCNPYDTQRSPGTSSGGSGSSVAANLVTCSIGEETGGSIHHPAKNNSLVGLAPTQELVSRNGMIGAGLNTRVGPLCRTVKDAARVLDVIAGYDPEDELTAFSFGRLPVEPYQSFANARDVERHADRRHSRAYGQESVHRGRRRKHRYRRARDRRSAAIGGHDRRSRNRGSVVADVPRQICPALSQPGLHGTVCQSVSAGCGQKTVRPIGSRN